MTLQPLTDGPAPGQPQASTGLRAAGALPVSTVPEGGTAERGRQRNRRALVTSFTNLAAKLVTVATSFATVPLTLHYLGNERFGLWMTISSLTALLAFADLGLGNGLLNAVSDASGRDDPTAIRRMIASASVLLSGLALLLGLTLVPAILLFDGSKVFGLTDPLAVRELIPALLVFLLCFLLNIVAGVIARTQLGLQMGFLNGIAAAVGSVIGLAAVLLAIHLGAGLPWLIAGLLGGPLLALIGSGWWLFARNRPDLIPRRGDIESAAMARLARLGGLFFVLQIASAMAYASDNLIGARFVGATAVGEFSIATKLFSVVAILVPMFLAPLWPAYGEAIARADMAWVRRTLLRSTVLAAGLAGVAALALLAAFGPLTEWWLHRQPAVSATLLWGLVAWAMINAVGTGMAMFLNGAHVVWEQTVIAVVFALACLAAKLYFVAQHGLDAIPWATTITYLLLVLLPYGFLLPGILRRLSAAR